jgi:hypothetical protein
MGRPKQMPLFAAEQPPQAAADPEFVRRPLTYLLRLAQTAERLPWSEAQTASWEKLFRDLVDDLPEGHELQASFENEIKRLRSA